MAITSTQSAAVLTERGLIAITGPDARSFLNALVSNDVNKVTSEQAIYAALLTPQGKFLHDFFIVEVDGVLMLDCEGSRQADLHRRLTLYRLRAKVEIADATAGRAVTALFGPGALEAVGLGPTPGRASVFLGGIAYADPRLAELGVRTVMPERDAARRLGEAGFAVVGPSAYDRHRLGLGVPDGSRDLEVERALLLEANFEPLHGVDFAKGCYIGQELTARTKYRALVRKRLFRVDIDGPPPPPDTPILLGDTEAGIMRSSQDGVGLALLRLEQVAQAATSGHALTAGLARLTPIKPAWADF